MEGNKDVRRTTLQRVDNLETVLDQLLATLQDHHVFERLDAYRDQLAKHGRFLEGAIATNQTLAEHWTYIGRRMEEVNDRTVAHPRRLGEIEARLELQELPPWARWWRRFREGLRDWRTTWLA